jgi:hypothetical protein
MRSRTIPSILLTLIFTGCTQDLPTAPSARGRVSAARAKPDRADLPFQGTLDRASHTDMFDPGTGMFLIHLVGIGALTHVGRFALVVDYTLNPATLSGPEWMKLAAANGDTLFAAGTTQGTPSEDGQSLTSREELTITGGTGRFAGAAGSFTLRQVDLAPDRFSSGSIEGTIGLAR